MDDDNRLIERYIAGDDMAIEELVIRYQKLIYAFVFRMVKDVEEAKDLTQKIFLNAINGVRGFKGRSSFKTWLYQIASNASLNHISRDRREEVELDDSIAGNQRGALSLLIEREGREGIRENMERLSERQRLAMILRAYEGLSLEETAAIMGCSEGAVKAHYHNGIKKMRTLLRDEGHETLT